MPENSATAAVPSSQHVARSREPPMHTASPSEPGDIFVLAPSEVAREAGLCAAWVDR